MLSCSTNTADPYCMKRCSPATGSNLVPIQIHMGPRFCKHKAFWDNLSPSPLLQLLCWDVLFGNHQNAACLRINKHWGHCDFLASNSRIQQYADSKELGEWLRHQQDKYGRVLGVVYAQSEPSPASRNCTAHLPLPIWQ